MNGTRVCIDTNVFLNVLNKEKAYLSYSREVLLAISRGDLEAIIPTLVISEVLTGFYIEKRKTDAEEFLAAIVTHEHMKVIPLSMDIAVSSAIVRAKTGLKLPDAMILATAIENRTNYIVSNDENLPRSYKGVKTVKSIEMTKLMKGTKEA